MTSCVSLSLSCAILWYPCHPQLLPDDNLPTPCHNMTMQIAPKGDRESMLCNIPCRMGPAQSPVLATAASTYSLFRPCARSGREPHQVGSQVRPGRQPRLIRTGSAQSRDLAAATAAALVMPNFSYRMGAGAEAPYWSTPMVLPLEPVYRSQPKVEPASTDTCTYTTQSQYAIHCSGVGRHFQPCPDLLPSDLYIQASDFSIERTRYLQGFGDWYFSGRYFSVSASKHKHPGKEKHGSPRAVSFISSKICRA